MLRMNEYETDKTVGLTPAEGVLGELALMHAADAEAANTTADASFFLAPVSTGDVWRLERHARAMRAAYVAEKLASAARAVKVRLTEATRFYPSDHVFSNQ